MPRFSTAALCVLASLAAPALALAQAPGPPRAVPQPQGPVAPPQTAPASALPQSVFVSAASYADKIARTNNGSVTHNLPASPGTSVGVIHRDAIGLVDIHGKWNEQFVIFQGAAVMRVGGKLVGAREVSPGEFRGGVIEGGESYTVGPGDVVWVRAGVPHQMVLPPGGDIRYFIFKDTTTAPAP